jgi:hypothetical protein
METPRPLEAVQGDLYSWLLTRINAGSKRESDSR